MWHVRVVPGVAGMQAIRSPSSAGEARWTIDLFRGSWLTSRGNVGGSLNRAYPELFSTPKFGVETHEAFKRYDFGAQLGGGVLLANKIVIDLRCSRSLTTINSGEPYRNIAAQLSVGIPISKK